MQLLFLSPQPYAGAPTFWALCSSSFRNSEPFSRISMEELRRRDTSSGAAAGCSSPRVSSQEVEASTRPPGDSLSPLLEPRFFQGTEIAERPTGRPLSCWGGLQGKQGHKCTQDGDSRPAELSPGTNPRPHTCHIATVCPIEPLQAVTGLSQGQNDQTQTFSGAKAGLMHFCHPPSPT